MRRGTLVARVKEGVTTSLITDEAIRIIQAVRIAYERAINRVPTITSWMDGRHRKGSRHFIGLALDFRTWGIESTDLNRIAAEIRALLGDDYDVVIEPTHLHVEYDPKGVVLAP